MEMNDAGNLSEADSLASTAPSEQGSEYEVEEILAERVSKRTGKKKFLLKWADYPMYRATWESAEMFLEMEDAILKWNEKTRKVKAGTDQPFDVDAWKKSLKDRERETQRRKEARRQKRAERAAQKSNKPPSRESSPDIPLMQASRQSSPDVPLARVSAHRGASLASDTSLFVSTDDPTPIIPLSHATPTTNQSLQLPSSGPVRAKLNPPDLSQSNVSENPEKLLPQLSQAATDITSDKSQIISHPRVPGSAKPSQPSENTVETSKTALSKQDKVSQGTGQTSATRTVPPQKSRRSLPSQPALGPLYTAFASNKKDREPDISQLDLRRPSEFPARTAAGVPVPFAKMTASDKFRRSSQSGTKATPNSSVSQAASSGSSRRWSPETMGPASRPQGSSPRGFSLLNGGDCYRPGESSRLGDYDSYRPGGSRDRDSPPPRRPDRRRSPGARSRSPNQRYRSPDRRRSPASRRRSPYRVADAYRPKNSSPFVTVTRPKSQTQTPLTTPITRPSPPDTVTNTENNTGSTNNTVSANATVSANTDALALAARPLSPPKAEMSAKEQIDRMPIGEPGPNSMRFKGSPYFVNKVEVLAHIYFGTERQPIGAVRLCGLSPEVKQDLLANKRPGKFEMWFKELCTPDQYATLCREEENFGGSNRVIRTCWMEGFADTNPYIFHIAEGLYWKNKIGIYYPPGNEGFVWLAYSPKSPDFTHLTQPYPEINPWVPIRLAVRTPLAPIDALHKQQSGPQHQSTAMAMVPYDPSNPSIIGASGSLDDVVRRLAHTAGPSNPHTSGPVNSNTSIQVQGSYGSPIQSPMERSPDQQPLPSQAAHSLADPRLKRLSSVAMSTQQPNDHLVGAEGLPDSMDTRPDNTVPTNTALISDPQQLSDRNLMLSKYFELNLKMSFKELACVNGKPGGSQADVFYLHTPESVEDQNDCNLLKVWLELNGAMVWSDWAKFVKNSKCGVILVCFLSAVQIQLIHYILSSNGS